MMHLLILIWKIMKKLAKMTLRLLVPHLLRLVLSTEFHPPCRSALQPPPQQPRKQQQYMPLLYRSLLPVCNRRDCNSINSNIHSGLSSSDNHRTSNNINTRYRLACQNLAENFKSFPKLPSYLSSLPRLFTNL